MPVPVPDDLDDDKSYGGEENCDHNYTDNDDHNYDDDDDDDDNDDVKAFGGEGKFRILK